MIRLSTATSGFTAGFAALLSQARETTETVDQAVAAIIADIRARGDAALLEYTARFDRLPLTADRLRISAEEIETAVASVPAAATEALNLAASRIEAFHQAQLPADLQMTDAAGMTLLRCSLCALHSEEQVGEILGMFAAAGRATGCID